MTYPNPGMVWQLKKPAARLEKCVGASPGKIGAGRAKVNMKDRVTDEHIICKGLC